MKKFIRFEQTGTSLSGRTKTWLIKNIQSEFTIGKIYWHIPWRKYVLEPANNCIFDTNCLQEVIDFIGMEMTEKKAGAKVYESI